MRSEAEGRQSVICYGLSCSLVSSCLYHGGTEFDVKFVFPVCGCISLDVDLSPVEPSDETPALANTLISIYRDLEKEDTAKPAQIPFK